jgi:hypothetical protein
VVRRPQLLGETRSEGNGLENARVATRENGEQRGAGGSNNATFAGVALARSGPKTAPTLGERAKKSQPTRLGILGIGGGGGNRTRVRESSPQRSTCLASSTVVSDVPGRAR